MKTKSHVISDPDLIGLECDSGVFTSNCNLTDNVNENVPIGCEGVFMFSDQTSGCESPCQQKDTRSGRNDFKKKGWTNFMSADTPLNKDSDGNVCTGATNCKPGTDGCCSVGTGDHEHYSFFQKRNNIARDRLKVYQSDGTLYEDCTKKAIHVRKRNGGESWWELSKKFTL